MRIKVQGTSQSVAVLRSHLEHPNVGYIVSGAAASFTIILDDDPNATHITVDSIDSPLERNIINCIAELTDSQILLARAGGIQDETSIRLIIPVNTDPSVIERGVLRGILKTTKHKISKPWWMRLLPFLGIFVLSTFVYGQQPALKPAYTHIQPKIDIAKVKPSDEFSLRIRNLQFEQDKALLQMKDMERQYVLQKQKVDETAVRISAAAEAYAKDNKVDMSKYVFDLDTLEFVLRSK